jgi:predicted 2-oxoglutarate/Fe(II)-dependent dioxygenase YbiX
MLKVNRILILGGDGNCNDKAYPFVTNILKRRYGNAVTFAFDFETEQIITQLGDAGFKAALDGYSWNISEPEDFTKGKEVFIDSTFSIVKMIVKDVINYKGSKLAKVVYADRPRKKAVHIYIPTLEEFQKDVCKSVGIGGWEALQKNKMSMR